MTNVFARFIGKFSKTTLIIISSIIFLLVAIRIALPYILLDYANKVLSELPEYDGYIKDIDLHIYRGGMDIEGIHIEKTGGKIPVPFVQVTEINFSIDWSAIFDGALVAKIEVWNPKINIVNGPTKETTQATVDTNWIERIKNLNPININRFSVYNGELHYRDFHRNPKVDVYTKEIYVNAYNLTNSKSISKSLFGSIDAWGTTMESGKFKVHVELNPFEDNPTFNMDMSIDHIELIKLNNFIRAYGNFDVQGGTFGLYTEFAAAGGKFEGYLKPIFKELKVFSLEEEHKNFLQAAWEAVVGLVAEIFENQPKEQIATRIPVSGTFKAPAPDVWESIWELIKNAFIQALIPGIEQRIGLKDVNEKR